MKDVINGNSAFAIQLLQGAEGYKGMSEEQKQDFSNEFSVQQKGSAHYEAMKNLPEEKETKEEKTPGSGKIASLPESTNLSKDDIKNLQAGLNELHKDGHLALSKNLDIDGIYGPKTKEAVKLLQHQIGSSADGIWGPDTKNKFLGSNLSSYKTGGLADFTGPAWLDGTKSKPEYILNADQTKAFFSLVDVLGSLWTGTSQTTQNSGDNTYDIDINVESIGSDYDVEQLAETIKRLINEDARYRNNNAINLMR
jgi:N-acetylmuramoyl-L-alanine amidase